MDGFDKIERRFASGWDLSVDVSPGWHQLLVDLDETLAEIDPDYVIHQVKEKFGGLRFYAQQSTTSPTSEEFDKLIAEAERNSYTICERCSLTEDVTTASNKRYGWVRTLCAACRIAILED